MSAGDAGPTAPLEGSPGTTDGGGGRLALLESEIGDIDREIEWIRREPVGGARALFGRMAAGVLVFAAFWRLSMAEVGFVVVAVGVMLLQLLPAIRRDRRLDELNLRRAELAAERRRLLP